MKSEENCYEFKGSRSLKCSLIELEHYKINNISEKVIGQSM